LSQKEVYEILKELGGRATTREIKLRAQTKFPGLTLHAYVTNRLNKLKKNGYVKSIYENGKTVWTIIAEYP
jgi:Fe2+ or Zn2+ uptake regulation protein